MTLWQSPAWECLQKSLGVKTLSIDSILVLIKPLPFQYTFFEIQRASPTTPQWQKIRDLARTKNALFCRFAPANFSPQLPKLPLKKNPSPIFPDTTRIIDLTAEETEIFASFSTTGRRHIRLAEKSGIKVSESGDVLAFAELSKITAKRDGFRAHDANYFRKFLDAFGDKARLLVAESEREWLAAGIFTFVGNTAVYYYGASSDEKRELNAPTLLQWEAMKMAKRKECEEFDLLGVAADEEDPHHRLAGVTRFKKKFSGKIVSYYPESDVIFSRGKYELFQFMKALKGKLH